MSTPDRNKVRAQFAKTAQSYVSSVSHAKGEELATMVGLAGPLEGRAVLDVATGAGHTAFAFARAGAHVTATDLTPQMLAAAETVAKDRGVENVTFLEARAEALPFPEDTFDIVTCRIAAHHFERPSVFVAEVARVLCLHGLLIFVDNIAPVDGELAGVVNTIERWRDPSHVQAYSVAEWVAWLAGASLELLYLTRFFRKKSFQSWLETAQTPNEERGSLERYILELPSPHRGYLQVEAEGESVKTLSHEVVLLVAKRMVT